MGTPGKVAGAVCQEPSLGAPDQQASAIAEQLIEGLKSGHLLTQDEYQKAVPSGDTKQACSNLFGIKLFLKEALEREGLLGTIDATVKDSITTIIGDDPEAQGHLQALSALEAGAQAIFDQEARILAALNAEAAKGPLTNLGFKAFLDEHVLEDNWSKGGREALHKFFLGLVGKTEVVIEKELCERLLKEKPTQALELKKIPKFLDDLRARLKAFADKEAQPAEQATATNQEAQILAALNAEAANGPLTKIGFKKFLDEHVLEGNWLKGGREAVHTFFLGLVGRKDVVIEKDLCELLLKTKPTQALELDQVPTFLTDLRARLRKFEEEARLAAAAPKPAPEPVKPETPEAVAPKAPAATAPAVVPPEAPKPARDFKAETKKALEALLDNNTLGKEEFIPVAKDHFAGTTPQALQGQEALREFLEGLVGKTGVVIEKDLCEFLLDSRRITQFGLKQTVVADLQARLAASTPKPVPEPTKPEAPEKTAATPAPAAVAPEAPAAVPTPAPAPEPKPVAPWSALPAEAMESLREAIPTQHRRLHIDPAFLENKPEAIVYAAWLISDKILADDFQDDAQHTKRKQAAACFSLLLANPTIKFSPAQKVELLKLIGLAKPDDLKTDNNLQIFRESILDSNPDVHLKAEAVLEEYFPRNSVAEMMTYRDLIDNLSAALEKKTDTVYSTVKEQLKHAKGNRGVNYKLHFKDFGVAIEEAISLPLNARLTAAGITEPVTFKLSGENEKQTHVDVVIDDKNLHLTVSASGANRNEAINAAADKLIERHRVIQNLKHDNEAPSLSLKGLAQKKLTPADLEEIKNSLALYGIFAPLTLEIHNSPVKGKPNFSADLLLTVSADEVYTIHVEGKSSAKEAAMAAANNLRLRFARKGTDAVVKGEEEAERKEAEAVAQKAAENAKRKAEAKEKAKAEAEVQEKARLAAAEAQRQTLEVNSAFDEAMKNDKKLSAAEFSSIQKKYLDNEAFKVIGQAVLKTFLERFVTIAGALMDVAVYQTIQTSYASSVGISGKIMDQLQGMVEIPPLPEPEKAAAPQATVPETRPLLSQGESTAAILIAGSGADPKAVRSLSENLVQVVTGVVGDDKVLTLEGSTKTLGFSPADALKDCGTDALCLSQIGAALGVGKLVLGKVSSIYTDHVTDTDHITYRVDLMLVDVKRSTIEKQQKFEKAGGSPQEVRDAFELFVKTFLGEESAKSAATATAQTAAAAQAVPAPKETDTVVKAKEEAKRKEAEEIARFKQEFPWISVEAAEGSSFEPGLLDNAAVVLRKVPETQRKDIRSITRKPSCASGKCGIASGNHESSAIEIFDSLFDDKMIQEHFPEVAGKPVAERMQAVVAHEIAEVVVGKRTHADLERLLPTFKKKSDFIRSEDIATEESAFLRTTLLYSWSQINGWSISKDHLTGYEEHKEAELLYHINGGHGEELLANADKFRRQGASIPLGRWKVVEGNWLVRDKQFVSQLAGDLKRGPEHSLVEAYAAYLFDPKRFDGHTVLQQQRDFVRNNFFTAGMTATAPAVDMVAVVLDRIRATNTSPNKRLMLVNSILPVAFTHLPQATPKQQTELVQEMVKLLDVLEKEASGNYTILQRPAFLVLMLDASGDKNPDVLKARAMGILRNAVRKNPKTNLDHKILVGTYRGQSIGQAYPELTPEGISAAAEAQKKAEAVAAAASPTAPVAPVPVTPATPPPAPAPKVETTTTEPSDSVKAIETQIKQALLDRRSSEKRDTPSSRTLELRERAKSGALAALALAQKKVDAGSTDHKQILAIAHLAVAKIYFEEAKDNVRKGFDDKGKGFEILTSHYEQARKIGIKTDGFKWAEMFVGDFEKNFGRVTLISSQGADYTFNIRLGAPLFDHDKEEAYKTIVPSGGAGQLTRTPGKPFYLPAGNYVVANRDSEGKDTGNGASFKVEAINKGVEEPSVNMDELLAKPAPQEKPKPAAQALPAADCEKARRCDAGVGETTDPLLKEGSVSAPKVAAAAPAPEPTIPPLPPQESSATGKLSDVTAANFEEVVLKSTVPVLVEFWKVGCPPCERLAPKMPKFAEALKGKVKVVKLNVKAPGSDALRIKYDAQFTPTMALFNRGEKVGLAVAGGAEVDDVVKWVEFVLEPKRSAPPKAPITITNYEGFEKEVLKSVGPVLVIRGDSAYIKYQTFAPVVPDIVTALRDQVKVVVIDSRDSSEDQESFFDSLPFKGVPAIALFKEGGFATETVANNMTASQAVAWTRSNLSLKVSEKYAFGEFKEVTSKDYSTDVLNSKQPVLVVLLDPKQKEQTSEIYSKLNSVAGHLKDTVKVVVINAADQLFANTVNGSNTSYPGFVLVSGGEEIAHTTSLKANAQSIADWASSELAKQRKKATASVTPSQPDMSGIVVSFIAYEGLQGAASGAVNPLEAQIKKIFLDQKISRAEVEFSEPNKDRTTVRVTVDNDKRVTFVGIGSGKTAEEAVLDATSKVAAQIVASRTPATTTERSTALSGVITFAANSSNPETIPATDEQKIDALVALLQKDKTMKLVIEGHKTSSEAVETLPRKRAAAVKNWFVEKGIPTDRLEVREAAKAKSRRDLGSSAVTFKVWEDAAKAAERAAADQAAIAKATGTFGRALDTNPLAENTERDQATREATAGLRASSGVGPDAGVQYKASGSGASSALGIGELATKSNDFQLSAHSEASSAELGIAEGQIKERLTAKGYKGDVKVEYTDKTGTKLAIIYRDDHTGIVKVAWGQGTDASKASTEATKQLIADLDKTPAQSAAPSDLDIAWSRQGDSLSSDDKIYMEQTVFRILAAANIKSGRCMIKLEKGSDHKVQISLGASTEVATGETYALALVTAAQKLGKDFVNGKKLFFHEKYLGINITEDDQKDKTFVQVEADRVNPLVLTDILTYLSTNPTAKLRITGFAETSENVRGLAKDRAQGIADALIARGINAKRLEVVAGTTYNTKGVAENRRVEFKITNEAEVRAGTVSQ